MIRRLLPRALALTAAFLGPLATTAADSAAQGRGTGSGRYTVEQADAGQGLYAIHCAMCHGPQLAGTVEVPPLVGRFVAHWADRPLGDLFAYVSSAMPQHAPGSLSPEQNAQILAYLLKANGAPSGRNALSSDLAALNRIVFDAPGT